jgi:hypothetical protein
MTLIKVEHVKSDKLHPLHCQYAGQTQPQESYLELDVISGKLSASYSAEIGNGAPFAVWHGIRRRYSISAQLTADEINSLMDYVTPIAQQIINGAKIEYDSQMNHIADLNDSAEKAEEEMEGECNTNSELSRAELHNEGVWDAEVYYNMTTNEEMGLTSETTDEQLKQIIEDEQHVAESDGRTVNGLEDYLENELKTLRENALEETE